MAQGFIIALAVIAALNQMGVATTVTTPVLVAVLATVIGLGGGMVLGTVAGAFGGWVDSLVMRVVDVLLSIPSLLLAVSKGADWGWGCWRSSSCWAWSRRRLRAAASSARNSRCATVRRPT